MERTGTDSSGARRRLVATGAALTAVAIAVPAAAGLSVKKAVTTVEFNTAGSAAAKCKHGTKPIAGGFLDKAFEPGPGSRLYPYVSRKAGRKWVMRGFNLGGGNARLASYAYCARTRLETVRSEEVAVAPSGIAKATARCDKGERAFSGGFADRDFDTVPPADGSRVTPFASLKRGPRKWTVMGFNNAASEGDFAAYAYCAEGPHLRVRMGSEALDPTETGTAQASCRRTERAVSGGFEGEFDPTGTDAYILTFGLHGDLRRWDVYGYNDGLTEGTLTAYAYCLKQ